nr:MAG TPA: hypothetical protein [Caudoviricetes sp.]
MFVLTFFPILKRMCSYTHSFCIYKYCNSIIKF